MPNTRKSIFSIPWWRAAEEDFAWIPKLQWWLRIQHVLVYAIHFSDQVINKNEKRFWFINKLKHVPLIASPIKCFWWCLEIIKVQRKSPKARIFQEDHLEEFKKSNTITSLDDINEKQMKSLGEGSFLEKIIFTEATTQHFRTDARFFRWLKPSCRNLL